MSIDYHGEDSIAWITLNRPEALNALDTPDLESLLVCLDQAASDDAVQVVAIRAAGRAFCVGADIKSMEQMSDADFRRSAALYQALASSARGLHKPILGAINGYALGGGLELALMCDLRIAATSARFGLPDAELGFSPTGGLTWSLVRTIGLGAAMDMALSCDTLDAIAAQRVGLVNRVVEDEALDQASRELAKRIAAFPATALRNLKRSFYAAAESSFATALALEEVYDADCFRATETHAALRAFIESRRGHAVVEGERPR